LVGESSSEPFEFARFGELIWTDPAFRMEQSDLKCSLSIERAAAKHTYFQRDAKHEHQDHDALTVVTEPDAGLFLLRAEKWNNFLQGSSGAKSTDGVKRLGGGEHNSSSRLSPANLVKGHCVTLPPEFAGDLYLFDGGRTPGTVR
jgi:hypothetical protein